MTQKFRTLSDCIAIAEVALRNQTDKAGFGYIEHPKRVLRATQDRGAPPYAQMAAILHDVTEDTAFTCDMLLELGIPEAAVNIVRLLDRDHSKMVWDSIEKNENNEVWVKLVQAGITTAEEFYYYAIRQNHEALGVKLDDIKDNTQVWRMSYLPPATQDRLNVKYTKAVDLLTRSTDA